MTFDLAPAGDEGETLIRLTQTPMEVEGLDDPERVADLAQHVVRRNYPETPEDEVPAAARGLARKRTGVVVQPEKIFSWDHRRLT